MVAYFTRMRMVRSVRACSLSMRDALDKNLQREIEAEHEFRETYKEMLVLKAVILGARSGDPRRPKDKWKPEDEDTQRRASEFTKMWKGQSAVAARHRLKFTMREHDRLYASLQRLAARTALLSARMDDLEAMIDEQKFEEAYDSYARASSGVVSALRDPESTARIGDSIAAAEMYFESTSESALRAHMPSGAEDLELERSLEAFLCSTEENEQPTGVGPMIEAPGKRLSGGKMKRGESARGAPPLPEENFANGGARVGTTGESVEMIDRIKNAVNA